METKVYNPRVSNRRRTERESIRSLMDESDENIDIFGGESEVIKGIGHTTDDIKLTPKQRKMESGFSSLLHGNHNHSESHKRSTNNPKSNHTSVNESESAF
jgi:hypothetical protein